MTAKQFFESVAEASRDAERVQRLLANLQDSATRLSSQTFEPRVKGGSHDRMERTVANMVDREAALHRRLESDYALIDAAHAVLYGTDTDAGLWVLLGWRADAISLHYVDGLTWPEVAQVLGFSQNHVWQQVQAAFDLADANGMGRTVAGMGLAT